MSKNIIIIICTIAALLLGGLIFYQINKGYYECIEHEKKHKISFENRKENYEQYKKVCNEQPNNDLRTYCLAELEGKHAMCNEINNINLRKDCMRKIIEAGDEYSDENIKKRCKDKR